MRRILLLICAWLPLAAPANAEITSAYSKLDAETGCTTLAAAEPDEGGDWVNLVCDGHRGYPVFVNYGDARESLFYGFPPDGDLDPPWESFDAFNSAGDTIEWRLDDASGHPVPFATIHRWFVSDPLDESRQIEVLVVEKVGQPGEREGCAVAYVVSTGNPGANEKARGFADRIARDFVCGSDEPSIDSGSEPLPSYSRAG